MPSTFPTTIDVFDPHPPIDGFDFVMADHIGQLQDAVTAVEQALGENLENVSVPANINAATVKATPASADEFGFFDVVSLTLKKLTWANIKTALASTFDWATITHAATAKTTPADADEFSIADSAASWVIKKLTWANIKTALAAIFDWATITHAATQKVTPVNADELSITDSAASWAIKRIQLSQLATFLSSSFTAANTTIPIDGWVNANETWTYVSASSFRVTGDKTGVYKKGTKLLWTQSSVAKRGVVISSSYSSPYTTINIFVNTDFTIANTTITNNFYSYIENPLGWSGVFNWSPTFSNLTVGNATVAAIATFVGESVCKFSVSVQWAASPTSSIAGAVTLTPPVTPNTAHDYLPVGPVGLIDTGVALYMGEAVYRSTTGLIDIRVIKADGTYATWTFISSSVPFTWGANDLLTINGDIVF